MTELRVGIVGAGHIARTHVRAWRRAKRARVVSVSDLDTGRAEALANEFSIGNTNTLEDTIASSDVVDVCTPPTSHYSIARDVLASDRHLLIEKPLVTRVSEWEKLRATLGASRARIAVVHNLRFSAGVLQAARWLQDGKIGRLLRIQRTFLTSPLHDRMLGGEHWSHSLPGGRWAETLPHALYLLYHFAGPLDLANVATAGSDRPVAGTPASEVTLLFQGQEALATVHYSANCKRNARHLVLDGSRGRIRVDTLADSALLLQGGDRRWRRMVGADLPEVARRLLRWPRDRAGYVWNRVRRITPHARLIASFADHLTVDGPAPVSLDEIDYVIRQTEAVGQAIEDEAGRNA